MSLRHRSREIALQTLYRVDPELTPADGARATKTDLEIAREISAHFDHFQVTSDLREFAAKLVAGVWTNADALDQLLEKQTSNWKVSRMAQVDRCLLRMALYELTHCKETPPAVVIDEAVELAKQFGNAESAGFVNGILDAIRKSLE